MRQRKIEKLTKRLEEEYVTAHQIREEIFSQSIDPMRVSTLLTEFEASNERRDQLRRRLNEKLDRPYGDWFYRLFRS